MPTNATYVSFILEQLSELEGIRCRPMMGEYLLYYQEHLFGGIYDNRLLVKPVPAAFSRLPHAVLEKPYAGAKEMLLVENLENRAFLAELIVAMAQELPVGRRKQAMAFDFKKEYKEFYQPAAKPTLVTVPEMHYLAVRGEGDPNEVDGAYQRAIAMLYGVAYTIKMSKRSNRQIAGYFDYVVPPLEGFWQQSGTDHTFDLSRKQDFRWISVIRLPDFVTQADVDWAITEAARKKKQDYTAVEFLTLTEGCCVQMLHVGSYDAEAASIAWMRQYASEQGYAIDLSQNRQHHEIYLSDARRVAPEKRKTVIRIPIRKAESFP